MWHKIFIVLVLFFLQACAFVAEESEQIVQDGECRVERKNLDLTLHSFDQAAPVACTGEACIFAMLVVPVGSFVVSGSIVLANNVVNWVEYQGKCGIPELFDDESEAQVIEETCMIQCNPDTGVCSCID
jgi:hypothetical protein